MLWLRCYEWLSVQNRRFRSEGQLTQKFQVEGLAPTSHSFSQKTRLNDLLYGIKIWTDFTSILSQLTHLTERQTEFSSLHRICIPCSVVKTTEMVGNKNTRKAKITECLIIKMCFKFLFKTGGLCDHLKFWSSLGRELHSAGPQKEKAHSPIFVYTV